MHPSSHLYHTALETGVEVCLRVSVTLHLFVQVLSQRCEGDKEEKDGTLSSCGAGVDARDRDHRERSLAWRLGSALGHD
jgi:hypothetical protein